MLQAPPTYHPLQETTIQCQSKHCQPTTRDPNVHYVNVYTPVANAPSHCPSCNTTHITHRPYDIADELTTQYSRYNRLLANVIIEETREYNHAHPTATINHLMFVRIAKMQTPTLTSQGLCPVWVTCQSCAGTYALVRTTPTANTLPTYCIWCGSQQLTVRQFNTDEVSSLVLSNIAQESLQSLADHYNIPLPLLTFFYDDWTTSSHLTFFAEYMRTPDVKTVLALKRAMATSKI